MCNKKPALAWKIVNEITQTEQHLKQTVENRELNY